MAANKNAREKRFKRARWGISGGMQQVLFNEIRWHSSANSLPLSLSLPGSLYLCSIAQSFSQSVNVSARHLHINKFNKPEDATQQIAFARVLLKCVCVSSVCVCAVCVCLVCGM